MRTQTLTERTRESMNLKARCLGLGARYLVRSFHASRETAGLNIDRRLLMDPDGQHIGRCFHSFCVLTLCESNTTAGKQIIVCFLCFVSRDSLNSHFLSGKTH